VSIVPPYGRDLSPDTQEDHDWTGAVLCSFCQSPCFSGLLCVLTRTPAVETSRLEVLVHGFPAAGYGFLVVTPVGGPDLRLEMGLVTPPHPPFVTRSRRAFAHVLPSFFF